MSASQPGHRPDRHAGCAGGSPRPRPTARCPRSSPASCATARWRGPTASATCPARSRDTQYKIGSITKTLTAVLVLQLVDEGLLSLDAPAVGRAAARSATPTARSASCSRTPAGCRPSRPATWWERVAGRVVRRARGCQRRVDSGVRAGSAVPLLQPRLRPARRGRRPAPRPDAGGRRSRRGSSTPLGMTRTSYQASGAHAEGWSVHPYAQTLIAEPLPDTAAMAPAGQVWSTVADLATYCRVPARRARRGAERRARSREAFTPQSGEEHAGLALRARAGLPDLPRRLGDAGRATPARCPGSTRSASSTARGARASSAWSTRPPGCRSRPSAPACWSELEQCEPTLPAGVAPNERGARGVRRRPRSLALGRDALRLRLRGRRPGGAPPGRRAVAVRRRPTAGSSGRRGYHAGEQLHVVRRDDGVGLAPRRRHVHPHPRALRAGAPIPGGRPDLG